MILQLDPPLQVDESRPCSPPMRDMVDLVLALRARADEIGISREALDERAGLPRGYAAKLLADPPVRQIGPVSLFPLVGALGGALVLVEDKARRQATQLQFRPRDGMRAKGTKWAHARKASIIRHHARKLAKMGGKARAAKLTPEQRTEIARRGAQARWAKAQPTIGALPISAPHVNARGASARKQANHNQQPAAKRGQFDGDSQERRNAPQAPRPMAIPPERRQTRAPRSKGEAARQAKR